MHIYIYIYTNMGICIHIYIHIYKYVYMHTLIRTCISIVFCQIAKRDLVISDKSQNEVKLSLWGESAEKFEGTPPCVVAVKGARVTEFNGKANAQRAKEREREYVCVCVTETGRETKRQRKREKREGKRKKKEKL